jgi:hypothetical protein
MRPRVTASVTLDRAFKPSNWTLTSRATKSKSPEVIETPFQTRTNKAVDLGRLRRSTQLQNSQIYWVGAQNGGVERISRTRLD